MIQWKEETDALVKWLQDMLKTTGSQGYVVGLSGGIDSSAAAALIRRAAGEHSLGLILPIHSDPSDAEHARMAAAAAGIDSMDVDLSEAHQNLLSRITTGLQHLGRNVPNRLADANLRARLRMSAIYAVANALNYLVVGTDNAAELFTGYFTKHGDGACDLLPLADFTKKEVRALGAYLGVPDVIVNKAPSAGLWPGQTDEDEMGLSYDTIDAFLQGDSIPETDKKRLLQMHRSTEHKRSLPVIYRRPRA